tara:strand:+ start:1294 stop:3546 length:2253 start_codon:yes stop_codon:yes gene_type:complete
MSFGAALDGINKGLFYSIGRSRLSEGRGLSKERQQVALEKEQLELAALQEVRGANQLMENTDIQNLVQTKFKDRTLLGNLNPIKVGDFMGDNPLLSANTVNDMLTTHYRQNAIIGDQTSIELVNPAGSYSDSTLKTFNVPRDNYVLRVIKPDGTSGVITVDGSNADDAEVVFRSPQQIRNHLNSVFNASRLKSNNYNLLLGNLVGEGLLGDFTSPTSNTADANANAEAIERAFNLAQGFRPSELDMEEKNKVESEIAFLNFEQDVRSRLKLLNEKDARELLDTLDQNPEPKNKYNLLVQLANNINRLSADVAVKGQSGGRLTTELEREGFANAQSLRVLIPKLDNKYFDTLKETPPETAGPPAPPRKTSLFLRTGDEKKYIQERRKLITKYKKDQGEDITFRQASNLAEEDYRNRVPVNQPVGEAVTDPTQVGTVGNYIDNFLTQERIDLADQTKQDLTQDLQAAVSKLTASPERETAIRAARDFLRENNIQSRADVERLIRSRPDRQSAQGIAFAYAVLASIDPKNAFKYTDQIDNLRETGFAGLPLSTARQQALERDRLALDQRKDAREASKGVDLTDDLAGLQNIIMGSDEKLLDATGDARINLAKNVARRTKRAFTNVFFKLYERTSPGSIALNPGVSASDEARFMGAIVLDLARFGTNEGEPGVFTRAFRTGDNVDILEQVGGNPLKQLQLNEDGNLVLIDTAGRVTNQVFTPGALRKRYGAQIVNTLLAYARRETENLRRPTSE